MHLPYQPLSPLTLFDYQGGYTAIILASARGHQYCVELLVLSGANVNAQNTVRRSTYSGTLAAPTLTPRLSFFTSPLGYIGCMGARGGG